MMRLGINFLCMNSWIRRLNGVCINTRSCIVEAAYLMQSWYGDAYFTFRGECCTYAGDFPLVVKRAMCDEYSFVDLNVRTGGGGNIDEGRIPSGLALNYSLSLLRNLFSQVFLPVEVEYTDILPPYQLRTFTGWFVHHHAFRPGTNSACYTSSAKTV